MGVAGRRRAETLFSGERMVDQTTAVYNQLSAALQSEHPET
jgi:hypothetical protein